MHNEPAVELSIRLSPAGGQVAGSLADDRGEHHSFSSFLGLLALLEQARQRALRLETPVGSR